VHVFTRNSLSLSQGYSSNCLKISVLSTPDVGSVAIICCRQNWIGLQRRGGCKLPSGKADKRSNLRSWSLILPFYASPIQEPPLTSTSHPSLFCSLAQARNLSHKRTNQQLSFLLSSTTTLRNSTKPRTFLTFPFNPTDLELAVS
jgi:hypothetical protein